MKELYSIMRELLEVEYNQQSLLYIIERLEAAYDIEERATSDLVVNGIRYYLTILQEELGIAIRRLDDYIAERAKQQ